MEITVTIPDEFAAQMQARGLTLQGYVEGLIERAVRTAPLDLRKQRNMQEFFREMAAHSDKIPQLPEQAFTRESFYQDHD